MDKKRWIPVPYYYTSPLSKLKTPENIKCHKPGYIPQYLRDAKANDSKNNALKS